MEKNKKRTNSICIHVKSQSMREHILETRTKGTNSGLDGFISATINNTQHHEVNNHTLR